MKNGAPDDIFIKLHFIKLQVEKPEDWGLCTRDSLNSL